MTDKLDYRYERWAANKEAEMEQKEEAKAIKLNDAIYRYIEDREPDILAEAINEISQDNYHWPTAIAQKVIRHLESRNSATIKTVIEMEIGAIVIRGIVDHAEKMVTLEY